MGAGELSEWAAGYCCHNGSDHLNCLLSLWVHLQGFFSFTLWFLLCQTLSGICHGSGLSPVASVHSSLMLNAYVASHWCLGDHGSGDPLAPGFCCVSWMDGGRAAVLESWLCLLMLDNGPPCLEFGYLVCRLLGHAELTEQVECACCPHPEFFVPPRYALIFGLCLLLWVT